MIRVVNELGDIAIRIGALCHASLCIGRTRRHDERLIQAPVRERIDARCEIGIGRKGVRVGRAKRVGDDLPAFVGPNLP